MSVRAEVLRRFFCRSRAGVRQVKGCSREKSLADRCASERPLCVTVNPDGTLTLFDPGII